LYCGLQVTVASAVALNIPAGLIALRIAKELSNPQDVKASPSIVTSAIAEPQQPTFAFLLFLFAVVGGTAFAYEIAWTRLLAITISSSTYALTLMLATFLTGTVIGSAFFRHYFASSGRVSLTTFSRTQALIGIAALTFWFSTGSGNPHRTNREFRKLSFTIFSFNLFEALRVNPFSRHGEPEQ
jgi:hypothetical protein